jgi:glycosyltransferase involved in cell wall biosynthesis
MTDSVIAFIPAFNEAANIAGVVARTRPHVAEVVVVDDGSADRTAEVAREAGATVLRHERNRGKGAAIVTALEHFAKSGASSAVFLDADGQHAPEEIPKFVAIGAPVVVGNRMSDTRDMPLVRLLTNRFQSWLTSRAARQPIPDSQCGFRLVRREVLSSLHLGSERFETETEMLIQAGRAGHKIASIAVRTIYDSSRQSRIRPLPDTIRYFKLIWKYRR